MDILFLLLLAALFVVQIIIMVLGIKKNKSNLLYKALLLEFVSIFVAAFMVYYFSEILYKYAPNFEGFFQIGCAAIFIPLNFIMLVATTVALMIKNAKSNKNP